MLMIKKLLIFSSIGFSLLLLSNASAMSDHETECAIWLCAPSGFMVGECDAPKKAMDKRIAKNQSPAPPFPTCGGEGNGMQRYNTAAYVPERTVCVDYWYDDTGSCRSYETLPEQYIKDTTCTSNDGYHYPDGCTHNYRYLDILIDGVQIGETYYSHPRRVY